MNILGYNIELEFPPVVEAPKLVFSLPNPFGGDPLPVTDTVVTTWFIMLFFVILFKVGIRKLEVVPSKKSQVIFEILYNFFDWLTESVLRKWKSKLFVYISTLMSFICIANILPMFPFPALNFIEGKIVIAPAFRAPTADLNTTLGLGVLTAILFVGFGIKAHGFGYFKEFLEPTPIMAPLHLISEVAKPFSISMRLFGNMFGGAVVMALAYMFASKVPPAPLLIGPFHLYFDLFIGLVQSFIFTMLTMVFISATIGNAEPGETHHH